MKLSGFHVEGTGGGCTALVRYFPTGHVVVLTDGNLNAPTADAGHADYSASLFTREAWQDSGQDAALSTFGTLTDVRSWATYVVGAA